jgi:hypothetical protein
MREKIEKGQRAERVQSLVGEGEGEKLRETQADMVALTDAYQQFLDTGGKQGITQTQYLDAVTARLDLVADKTQQVDRYSQQMQQTWQSAFLQMATSGAKGSEILEALLKDLTQLILQAQVIGPLFEQIFAWSSGKTRQSGNTWFDAALSIFGGAASGGVGGAVMAGVGVAANTYGAGGSGKVPATYDTSLDESWGSGGGMVKSATTGGNFAVTNNMSIGANADAGMIRREVSAAMATSQAQILSSMNRGGDFAQ